MSQSRLILLINRVILPIPTSFVPNMDVVAVLPVCFILSRHELIVRLVAKEYGVSSVYPWESQTSESWMRTPPSSGNRYLV